MHLESDEFSIIYDPTKVSLAGILEKIRSLGYRPEEIVAVTADTPKKTSGPLPELINTELANAIKDDKLLLLDFYAEWCGPCKVLEKNVLTDSDVRNSLVHYRLFKVDTDRFPEVAEYFNIKALPTLLVLDRKAVNRYRHMGLIEAEALARELVRVLTPERQEDVQ